jgi:hypothetical protein
MLQVTLVGCGMLTHHRTDEQERVRRYARVEDQLVDYSKRIRAYIGKHGPIDSNFDAAGLSTTLDAIYPDGSDHTAAVRLREDYDVHARATSGDYYSVMLCDRKTNAKLMEDFSCDTTHVEVTPWRSAGAAPCEFAADVAKYCPRE